MTMGECRVRTRSGPSNHDPSNDDLVFRIKRAAADLIDLIEDIDEHYWAFARKGEVARLKALAQTDVENAAMWAVKAATKHQMEK